MIITDGMDIEELESVLDQEYQCLLQGDLKALPDVMERKRIILEAAEGLLGGDSVNLSDSVFRKAERNQKLLTAAAAGLRSVLRRLHELRSIGDGSGTYQENGLRHEKFVRAGEMSRRA